MQYNLLECQNQLPKTLWVHFIGVYVNGLQFLFSDCSLTIRG